MPGDGRILAELGEVEAFELLEDHQHRDPARRGRTHAAYLVDAVHRADRWAFLGAVARKIGERHLRRVARGGVDRGDDLLRDRACIEIVGAVLGDRGKQSGLFGALEQRADGERHAVRCKEVRPRPRIDVPPEIGEPVMQPRGDREALLRELDRRAEQSRPGQLAVALVRQRHHPQVAGHPDAAPARQGRHERERLAVCAVEPFRVGCRGRGLAPVEPGDRVGRGVVVEHEAAPADPAILRLDDIEREHRRDRGVGRAATLAQDLGPGGGRARVGGADHSERRAMRGPWRRSWAPGFRSGGRDQQEQVSNKRSGHDATLARCTVQARTGSSQACASHILSTSLAGAQAQAARVPTASAMLANPSRARFFASPRRIRCASPGPWKTNAEYSWIRLAPAQIRA